MKTFAIEEAFEFVRNGLSVKQEDGKTGIPITRIETIWNSNIDKDRFGYADITEEKLKDIERYLLNKGDILMTHINSPKHLGKCAIYNNEPEKLIHGMNLLCLRPKAEILYPKYAMYFFSSGRFRSIIPRISNQSVNQASFSAGNLKDIQIPLPPLPTQQKIAAILDAADAYRQKTKTLIEKYDQLAQSLFLDMFGDPVRNEKGWEKEIAGKHIDLLTGNAFKSEKYSDDKNDMRLCGGLIIMPWGIEWDKANRWKMEPTNTLDRYLLKIDDIVMALDRPWISSGFKIAMIKSEDVPSLLVQRTARIRTQGISQHFLYFLLKHPGFERHTIPTETTVPHISPTDIKEYKIIIPPITLQTQFAERIQLIEAQKQHAEASQQKAEDLFNSLLQKAFKGELVS